jgi:hypothetical protein
MYACFLTWSSSEYMGSEKFKVLCFFYVFNSFLFIYQISTYMLRSGIIHALLQIRACFIYHALHAKVIHLSKYPWQRECKNWPLHAVPYRPKKRIANVFVYIVFLSGKRQKSTPRISMQTVRSAGRSTYRNEGGGGHPHL